jgi:glycosyltransferase involved in cell wall biosynthesis
LGRALDSVYAQTRAVDQVVVVNDCSPETEAVEAVLREYPRVTYVRNGTNVGLAATRNVGVYAAVGDIISFLDADDELHPQKIEYQLSLYQPDVAITCRVERIGSEVGIAGVEHYSGPCPFSTVTDSRSIIRRNRLTGASILLSRALFLKVDGYDDSLRSCEDFDLWLRLLDAGVQVHDIHLPLYLYRVNEAGLSRNYLNISRWELETVQKYFQRHRVAGAAVSGEGITLAFWLMKHLLRCETCLDRHLIDATVKNFELLTPWPILKGAVSLIQRLRVLRIVVMMRKSAP